MTVSFQTAILNGKRICFHNLTKFTVEIGKGRKGSYTRRFTFIGNLRQAVLTYNCINVGDGFKKRLRMGGKTLAREIA